MNEICNFTTTDFFTLLLTQKESFSCLFKVFQMAVSQQWASNKVESLIASDNEKRQQN